MAKKKAKKRAKVVVEPSSILGELDVTITLGKLDITVTKTSDGRSNYVQITSGRAAMPVNIVLIADEIRVVDHRPEA